MLRRGKSSADEDENEAEEGRPVQEEETRVPRSGALYLLDDSNAKKKKKGRRKEEEVWRHDKFVEETDTTSSSSSMLDPSAPCFVMPTLR